MARGRKSLKDIWISEDIGLKDIRLPCNQPNMIQDYVQFAVQITVTVFRYKLEVSAKNTILALFCRVSGGHW